MPKIVFKSLQKNIKIISAIPALLCFNALIAQQEISISYNEKIALDRVANDTKFYISGGIENIHLQGNEINDFVFSKPGKYKVKVVETINHKPGNCGHSHLPSEISVNVGRVKMTFDTTNLSLSKPIIKKTDTKGSTLSIPVRIETFDHKPARFNMTPVHSAGIGTSIIATPDPEFMELSEGIQTVKYHLTGVVTENSFLMFDFIDANGNIQSIALNTPVTN